MTKRVYEIDVYQKELNTSVVERIEEDDKKFLILEETIFFPEGGGQPCDLGMIEDIKVIDVRERGQLVYHQVDRFPETDAVHCTLDWKRRLDHMQQHCGEHILSGVIFKLYGGVNKGFHMGKDMVTIDIDLKEISPEMLEKVELLSNEAIYHNVAITSQLVHTQEEASAFPLRKQMTVTSDIRIVEIEGVDCVACCGTHPKLAGEVGLIKLYKAEKNKGMTRIFFKCGERALRDFQERHQILTQIMQLYSADVSSVVDKVQREKEKAASVREELRQLKMSVNNEWIGKHSQSEKQVIEVFENKTMEDLQYIVKKMTEDGFKHTLCFGSKKDFGVVLASSTINCGQLYKAHIKNFGGRGGGSPKMAQGSFQNEEDMMHFLNELTVLL